MIGGKLIVAKNLWDHSHIRCRDKLLGDWLVFACKLGKQWEDWWQTICDNARFFWEDNLIRVVFTHIKKENMCRTVQRINNYCFLAASRKLTRVRKLAVCDFRWWKFSTHQDESKSCLKVPTKATFLVKALSSLWKYLVNVEELAIFIAHQ